MLKQQKRRRTLVVCTVALLIISMLYARSSLWTWKNDRRNYTTGNAYQALEKLIVSQKIYIGKYDRTQFGDGWKVQNGCDTRNSILQRDLARVALSGSCIVLSGELRDPYTGMLFRFVRGVDTSSSVQIDHVVPLKDAWQKGAYSFSLQKRVQLANDPLELIAVDGRANQQKSDGDASEWLPTYIPFRCQYIARQIAVKTKYALTVTTAEKQAMGAVLKGCPSQALPQK